MSGYIELKYNNPICDIAKFGKRYLLLDEELKIHELDLAFKKNKSFTLFQSESQKEKKLILKNASICYLKENKVHLYSIKDKNFKEFSWFGENINSIAESNDGKMIAAGYSDGKVNVFLLDGEIYQSLLFDCGDVLNLAFNDSDNRLIINGSKNKTVVHDVDLNRTVSTIVTKTNIIRSLFIDDKRIFAVTVDGYTCILDTKENSIESFINNNITNPLSLALSPHKHYAIIGTKSGQVNVIFIERNKMLFTQKTHPDPVVNMKWIDETLFFLYDNGKVSIFPLSSEHKKIKEKIRKKNYDEVSSIMQNNRFLSIFSDIEKELDMIWNEDIFPKALDMILDNQKESAKELVVPFTHDVYKKKVFNLYIDKTDIIDIFLTAYNEKDYANVYFIVEKFPHLKKSTRYKTIESEWEIKYKKAFEIMKNGFKAQATQMLKKFNDVESKKNIISMLINFPKIFIDAQNLYKDGNINTYFTHVAKNSVLKQTPEFQEVIKETNNLMDKIEEAQKEGNYKDIVILSKKLGTYKPYKIKAQKFIDSVKSRISFINSINKDEIKTAYKIAEDDYEVTHMPQFRELYEKYLKAEKEAYKFALAADTEQLIFTIREFLEIPMLKDKISSIIKISYLKSFSNIKEIELVDWKSTIEYYSLYYGVDSDLKNTAKKVGFEKALYKILGGIDRYGYRKYDFVDDIIKYKTEEQLKEEKRIHIPSSWGHYIIVSLMVIIFVILVKISIDMFSTEIYEYKQERRHGPYKLFDRMFEYSQKGGKE